MFGFSRKRRLKEAQASLNRVSFITSVIELRKSMGFPEAKLSLENLVQFYAMNLAQIVFENAKKVPNVLAGRDAVEKAATLVVLTQTVHMGARMVEIGDKEQRSIIIENGVFKLLNTDIDNPSPEALAEFALVSNVYPALSVEKIEILREIDTHAYLYLNNSNTQSMEYLVAGWCNVERYVRGGEASA
jgi:hypothetical protein